MSDCIWRSSVIICRGDAENGAECDNCQPFGPRHWIDGWFSAPENEFYRSTAKLLKRCSFDGKIMIFHTAAQSEIDKLKYYRRFCSEKVRSKRGPLLVLNAVAQEGFNWRWSERSASMYGKSAYPNWNRSNRIDSCAHSCTKTTWAGNWHGQRWLMTSSPNASRSARHTHFRDNIVDSRRREKERETRIIRVEKYRCCCAWNWMICCQTLFSRSRAIQPCPFPCVEHRTCVRGARAVCVSRSALHAKT